MNPLIRFYKRAGKNAEKFFKATSTTPIFKGVSVPLKQTPGRAQYYYPETYHLIPEHILYKVRMPLKLAASEESTKYNDVVEQKVIEYLESKFGKNLFSPERGFNEDTTIGEIRYMLRASEKAFDRANTGEVQQILDNEKEHRENHETLQITIEDTLEDLEDKLDQYDAQTRRLFAESGIKSSASVLECTPFYGRSGNQAIIDDAHAALNSENSDKAQEILKRLYHSTKHRSQIAHVRLELVNCWNEYNETDASDKYNFEEANNKYQQARSAVEKFPSGNWTSQECIFHEDFDTLINKHLPDFQKACNDYESAKARKHNYYSSFVNDEVYDHNPEKLKEDMLAYLSGNIVLKEHRYRYQTEQYDRYLTLIKWLPMFDHTTLREFSLAYAAALREEIALSYQYNCPQIDANYDDYGEKKTQPINAAVFYYFISANRTRRKLAQVILSAARYPNEKLRRAYLRFFSNA